MDLTTILQQPNTTLIDVRQPLECLMGKAKGAVNIPLGTIPQKLDELKSIEGPIVAYCQSGNRSGQAVAFLKAQGIQEVYNGGSLEGIRNLQHAMK